MLFAENQAIKHLFGKGAHWTPPVLLNPGVTQWIVPAKTIIIQVWALGGGGNGGSTLRGQGNGNNNASGGGGGGLSFHQFAIDPGQIITLAIGGNTTVTYAPGAINMFAGRGGDGTRSNSNAGGGGGGGASGGLANVNGGRGGNGNTNGRGGGGGAPNNTSAGGGTNNGWQGFCMADWNSLFAMLNAVGIGTPLCGPASTPAANGTGGGRGVGGSGGSRQRTAAHAGGAGGTGLVVIRTLVKH